MRSPSVLHLSGFILLIIIFEINLTHAVKVNVIKKDVSATKPETIARIHVVAADAKRDEMPDDFDENNIEREEKEFKPLPFPVDFRFYDVNQNGEITLHELIEITGHAENVQRAFSASDLNGDGKVTADEYSQVPWGYNQNDYVYQS